LAAVGSFAHDLDVGLGVEDHREPGSDELLVVGYEHSDAHLGSTAVTVHPMSVFGLASRLPPSNAARSGIPIRPETADPSAGGVVSPSSLTVNRMLSWSPVTCTSMRVALRACL